MAHKPGHSDQGQSSGAGRPATAPASDAPGTTIDPWATAPAVAGAAASLVPAAAAGGMAAKPLESLSPSYDPEQHESYLLRLEEAVANPHNRNIALTGSYGAGKSSVLEEFHDQHATSTLRLAISSLTPGKDAKAEDEEGAEGGGDVESESTTNQIQKDIVKQLLYGASEKVGKNSRFRKIAVLSKPKASAQSAVFVVCAGGLLYLLGALPDIKWTGDSHDTWVRVLAWVGVAVLATGVAMFVRLATAGRFRVAEFSAGGAALTLDESPDSYFDKFLDEIVYYFGRESRDVVIFEDLDRFEDPGIFEALRELNLLLNETPERRRRRYGNGLGRALQWVRRRRPVNWLATKLPARLSAWLTGRVPDRLDAWLFGTGRPLRFVYALRDSVFEKLDTEIAAASRPGQRVDAAAAATMRANRTKFFDIVIPIVPFISHRSARDLLVQQLKERGIVGIEPRLVNTVAQHCTDMRLMRNMCNEYLMFAERLLEPKAPSKPAPGMNASRLFALVAYKNFHLGDFENITRRDSDLDRLYTLHQQMVRYTIAAKSERKRELLAEADRVEARSSGAEVLGQRLRFHAEPIRRLRDPNNSYIYLQFVVASEQFATEDTSGYAFWHAVSQARRIDMFMTTRPNGGQSQPLGTLSHEDLAFFAPEALDARRWDGNDVTAWQAEMDTIEDDIEDLRRAGFAELIRLPRFTLAPATDDETEVEPQTFAQLLESTMKSDLACDLVRRGYIDRNFSLYAAQFYGNFTGVDVAAFMVQHVQSNTMAIDYDLSRPGAVANLLAEADHAGEELTHTVAAFNIDIVNHLLTSTHPGDTSRAGDVVDNLIAGWGSDEVRTFLAEYFTAKNAKREKLASRLAEHRCRELFDYLVGDADVPVDARVVLFSAAAFAYDSDAVYDLGDDVRQFIIDKYAKMAAFNTDHPDDPSKHPADQLPERLNRMLERAGVIVPDLRRLGGRLRRLVVAANRYDLTADNLRSALGKDVNEGVPLEVIHGNDTVYPYCLEQLPAYLNDIDNDRWTGWAVTTSQTLVAVLEDLVADRESAFVADPNSGVVAELLARTSPAARLQDLHEAPESTWTALAAANVFRASLSNMNAYQTHLGAIDVHLATLLKEAGTVYADAAEDYEDPDGNECDREKAALALLNTAHIGTELRVDLAESLEAETPLPVENIAAESSDLFARLLERGLVDDDLATFLRLREGGWAALMPAILASTGIGTFLEHSVVTGMVANIVQDPATAAKVGRMVVDHVEDYVPTNDWGELKAVARYASAQRISLAPDTVVRIAVVGGEQGDVPRDLLLNLLSTTAPAATYSHIVAVFNQLGPDYDRIRQVGETLEFDRADPHDQLLKVLKAANLVTGTRGTKTHFRVTVT